MNSANKLTRLQSPRCAQFVHHEICATWLQDIALAAGFSSLRPEIGEKSSGRTPNGWCQKKAQNNVLHFCPQNYMQKSRYWIHKSLDTQGLQKVCRFIPGIWQARKVQTDQLRVAWPKAVRSQALRRFELSNVAMSKECVFDDWIILAGSTYDLRHL